MDWNAIIAQLADLPNTFQRSGTTYQWLTNASAAGLLRYTSAADGFTNQLNFQSAVGNWLDVWGKLFNIPRNNNESDGAYSKRIGFLLNSGKGTPAAMTGFIAAVEGITGGITENLPKVGYSIQLGAQTTAVYTQIANDLRYVRPAGVPFPPFQVISGGLYLRTVNYLGAAKVTGAYLSNPSRSFTPVIPSTTNNATPLLPTAFLTDTTLNPSLATS